MLLVVNGFTFIEFGTLAERMQTLLLLWEKTENIWYLLKMALIQVFS